jgi:hypothetical protein
MYRVAAMLRRPSRSDKGCVQVYAARIGRSTCLLGPRPVVLRRPSSGAAAGVLNRVVTVAGTMIGRIPWQQHTLTVQGSLLRGTT